MSFYDSKDISYFHNIRFDVINHFPNDTKRVLEIGCGEGNTLFELKRRGKADYIVGVDIKSFDQERILHRFLNIDIDKS